MPRTPRSEHLQVVDGVRAARRRKTPSPPRGAPRPPTTLSREAAAEWKRVVPQLAQAGMLAKVDRGLVTVWCRTWAAWARAMADVDKRGPLVDGDRGKVKNPSWQIARDASQVLVSLSKELGLSFGARTRLAVPDLPDLEADEATEDVEDVLA